MTANQDPALQSGTPICIFTLLEKKKNHLLFYPGTLLLQAPNLLFYTHPLVYTISSPNRHQAMKSSEEHYYSANCFLALYCSVIVRWIAGLVQAHSVCVRNREGDFSLLLLPAISYQSHGFL